LRRNLWGKEWVELVDGRWRLTFLKGGGGVNLLQKLERKSTMTVRSDVGKKKPCAPQNEKSIKFPGRRTAQFKHKKTGRGT